MIKSLIMRPPLGKADNVEVVESAPYEYLLEPNHAFKDIRGTRYFEHGSATLLNISRYIQANYHRMSGGVRSSHDPGCPMITGMFTSIKYNSQDILAFIESKKAAWMEQGYRISSMPPKQAHGMRERKSPPEQRHNLLVSKNPSVVFAFMGSNTQDSKMALACGLVEMGLISPSEVSADGVTIGWYQRRKNEE